MVQGCVADLDSTKPPLRKVSRITKDLRMGSGLFGSCLQLLPDRSTPH